MSCRGRRLQRLRCGGHGRAQPFGRGHARRWGVFPEDSDVSVRSTRLGVLVTGRASSPRVGGSAKVESLLREVATVLAPSPPRVSTATIGDVARHGDSVGRFAGRHPRGTFSSTTRSRLFVLAGRFPGKGRDLFSTHPSGKGEADSDRIQMRQRSWRVANDGWLE